MVGGIDRAGRDRTSVAPVRYFFEKGEQDFNNGPARPARWGRAVGARCYTYPSSSP